MRNNDVNNQNTVISKWGNSKGIRIPSEVLKEAKLDIDDIVYFESEEDGEITIRKMPMPKKGTIEYRFRNYSGEELKTELVDMGEPVGAEKWWENEE